MGQHVLDGGHDRLRRREPAFAVIAAGETARLGRHHVHTAPRASVARFSCTAGCSHISVCIAGATTTGARVASSVALEQVVGDAARVLPDDARGRRGDDHDVGGLTQPGVRDHLVTVEQLRTGGFRRERRERDGAHEARGVLGEHRHHVRAGIDHPATELDGLVRRDPARDPEDDARDRARRRPRSCLAQLASSAGVASPAAAAPSASAAATRRARPRSGGRP